MKKLLKSLSLVLAGIFLAGALLYGYSRFFNSPEEDPALRYVALEPGNAVISMISGEVYILREENIITPQAGDIIKEGDTIKVVDDSWCQIYISGKAAMNLRSNTLLKIQKLFMGNKDIDVRTELLTGSMIYKVDRLDMADRLEVQAQKKIYRVKGTEFIVEAFADGSRVAVREGNVAVLETAQRMDKMLDSVPGGKSLNLRNLPKGMPLPRTQKLSQKDEQLFKEETPRIFEKAEKQFVYLEIQSEPEGAQFYLEGRLQGKSQIKGLFPQNEKLNILARKRGYRDQELKINTGELASSNIMVKLEPLGLEESLEEEAVLKPAVTIEEIQARFEKETAELQQKLKEEQTLNTRLNRNNKLLAKEKKALKEEIQKNRKEQEKLKALLSQIQELSSEN